jgi:hypothetical protein
LVLKFHSGLYGAHRDSREGDAQPAFNAGQAIYNFLVPRPEMPAIARVSDSPAVSTPAVDLIPEVETRRTG